jgi:hypothetical protein
MHGLEHWTHFYTDYGVSLQRRFFDYFLRESRGRVTLHKPGMRPWQSSSSGRWSRGIAG